MSRKPARKRNSNNKYYSFRVFERPADKKYEKSKFLTGSAFMLMLAGFVMYKSLFSSSNVLGAYTSNLIAEERSGSDRVEKARETQQRIIEQYRSRSNDASATGRTQESGSVGTDAVIKCPVGEKEIKELSVSECRRLLEKRRLEMMQSQEIRMDRAQKRSETGSRSGEMKPSISPRSERSPSGEPRPSLTPKSAEVENEDEKENESESVRTRVEIEGDRMRIKTGSESGSEVVRDLTRGEQEVVKTGLAIEGKSIREENGRRVIDGGQIRAQTTLPISVNVGTNQLVVTTSTGDKEVSVLPEQAVESLNARGIVGDISNAEGVEVVDENGTPVYKIDGTEQRRLFGVLPLQFRSRFSISAVDGSVSQESANAFSSLLRALSF